MKLPDGSKLQAEHLSQFEAFAREKSISPDLAQSLLERESAAVSNYESAIKSNVEQVRTDWLRELQTDKEFGGNGNAEVLAANMEHCRRVLEQFAPPGWKQDLENSGLGNNPGLCKFLLAVAKASNPGSFVNPKESGSSNKEQSMADRMYPDMKK